MIIILPNEAKLRFSIFTSWISQPELKCIEAGPIYDFRALKLPSLGIEASVAAVVYRTQ